MFDNPVLKGIGEKHGKSAAQVILRWLIQKESSGTCKVNPQKPDTGEFQYL